MPSAPPTSHTSGCASLKVLRVFLTHRELTWALARRQISDPYQGSALGQFWAVMHPLFLMLLYVAIFRFVFRVKLPEAFPLNYTAYMIASYLPWMAFSDSLGRSTTAISASPNLVKQVVFPLDVLPLKVVFASLVPQVIGLVFLGGYDLWLSGSLPWTWLLAPVLLAAQAVAMVGLGYLLATLGVYFRDLKEFVQLFVTAGIFLIPVFYVPQMCPRELELALSANPFAHLVWCWQDVCFFGRFEHPWSWAVLAVGAAVLLQAGYYAFNRLKIYFANLL